MSKEEIDEWIEFWLHRESVEKEESDVPIGMLDEGYRSFLEADDGKEIYIVNFMRKTNMTDPYDV